MDQLGMTEAQRKATLRDGQDSGEMLLDIEAWIGELLPSAEEAQAIGQQKGRGRGLPKGTPLPKVLPEGMTNSRARAARAIKDHPDIVAKIKAQARENEGIPTKTAVLNTFVYEREQTRKEVASMRAPRF